MINIVSAIVLYVFLWFLTFLAVLPVRMQSQAERGEVTPGTPGSAPANPQMKVRLLITTVIATTLFALAVWIILSGLVTVEDIDIYNRWIHS